MQSKLAEAIALASSPIAVILTDEKPEAALQFKEGGWGCTAANMLAVSKGKTAVFDRRCSGCPGGATGLGFGNAFAERGFAIDKLLSTGDPEAAKNYHAGSAMGEGERFFKTPDLVRRRISRLPFTEVPTEYVVMKPLESISEAETPELIVFLVNPDQLSALIVMTDYSRGSGEPAIAPFGGACWAVLFGYEEAKRDVPRGVVGFFDIAQRHRVPRDTLSYTVPWKLFLQMEADVEDSFLELGEWQKLRERQ
jgi:uncharacterized protein (DUF169 family)